MGRIIKGLAAALVVLICVLMFNTLRYAPAESVVSDGAVPEVDAMVVAEKLSQAIQFRTISHPLGAPDRPSDFDAFLDWVPQAFPNATAAMSRVVISGYTPIYLWEGQDDSKPAILISGHYDVVPIESEWSRDPWAGEIAEGHVWGRGALDMKGGVVSFLQAAELLAADGFRPQHDIYFALTQDEEIGGQGGSEAVVAYFEENGIEIDWSLDEGSFVLRDMISSIDADIASINVAEKGYMTVEITATAQGGHSSLPQRDTAVSRLAQAIVELQADPMPGGLTDVSAEFFDSLGPHMGFVERTLFANRWLFRPVIESVLSGANTTDAMLRTTKAPTMLEGSSTENVLPQAARVLVNFRLHPRDTSQDVLDHIATQIEQRDITVNVLRTIEASPVADHQNDAFEHLSHAATQVFGDVVIVPGLTVGGTDSAKYSRYVGDSYRFLPFVFRDDDLALMHGRDERVSIDNLGRATQYYMVLLGGL